MQQTLDKETENFTTTWDDIDDNLEAFLHTEDGLALIEAYNKRLGGLK